MKIKKNNLYLLMVSVILSCIVITVLIGINKYQLTPHRVKDDAKITQLEESDPEYLGYIKDELKDIIKERYNVTPSKVGFFVYAFDSADKFDLQICYKEKNVWKEITINHQWSRKILSKTLSNQLWEVTVQTQ